MDSQLEGMSLSQIEQILRSRQTQVESLRRKRVKLEAQIQEIDEQIISLVGSADAERRGVRARNEKSLHEHIIDVLKKNKKGLTLAELADAVMAAGYQSNSRKFKNVLYQNLYGSDSVTRDANTGKYTLVTG